MKRGNTALKRVVSVASVAAMAIAGAVLAAPAASAWDGGATYTNLVRQTPTADSNWVNADGTVADAVQSTANYALTGTVRAAGVANNLVPGVNYQAAGGLQILLPLASGAPSWAKGDTLTVSLSGGGASPVTFSQAPSSISLSNKPIVSADLASRAGFSGTHATGASVDAGATAPTTAFHVGAALGATDKTKLILTLPDPAGAGGATTGDAYLLSIANVRLNVPADTDVSANVVSAKVSGLDVDGTTVGFADGGTTTLGYINSLKVSATGTPKVSGTTVTLPPVVVTEATKDAFISGTGVGFSLQVSGTKAATATVGFDKNATVTVATNAKDGATAGIATAITSADYTTGTPETDVASGIDGSSNATAIESVAISGLKVLNVKPGTDIKVTLLATGTALNYSTGTTTSTFSFAPSQTLGASATVAGIAPDTRIAGANRYETAADIAAEVGATDAVVIANGENAKQGVDALSANFLAGVKGAPILLTQADALPAETKDSLTSLFKGSIANITIYVMGKNDSVSAAVRDAAKAAVVATANPVATVTVKEVAGDDRYATSVKSAETADWASVGTYDLGAGNLRTAFLASGTVNADALAAGAVSAGSQIPVLLTTNGDALPKSVSDAIADQHIGQVVILGNTDRVSQKVEDALKAADVNVVRLAGTDRFDTSAKIATLDRKAATDGTGQATGNTVFLANGVGGWADALAAGPYVGGSFNSLLTVSDSDALPASVKAFISTYKTTAPKLTDVMGLGGTDRVTDAAITAAKDLLK